MRIALDVMGGDYAPDEILKGAIEAKPLLETDDRLKSDRSHVVL